MCPSPHQSCIKDPRPPHARIEHVPLPLPPVQPTPAHTHPPTHAHAHTRTHIHYTQERNPSTPQCCLACTWVRACRLWARMRQRLPWPIPSRCLSCRRKHPGMFDFHQFLDDIFMDSSRLKRLLLPSRCAVIFLVCTRWEYAVYWVGVSWCAGRECDRDCRCQNGHRSCSGACALICATSLVTLFAHCANLLTCDLTSLMVLLFDPQDKNMLLFPYPVRARPTPRPCPSPRPHRNFRC